MVKINYEKLNQDKANAVANANNNKKPGLSVSINYDKINAEAAFNDNLIKFRNERSDYFKAKSGWKSENSPKNEVKIDAYTSYDSTKSTSKDDVVAVGNELAEKVRNGTATDDDYRKYVNAEALYGEGLYNGFQSRIEAAPKYHVAPVVDSWDKTGIAESELWKTEDEYKKDASALTSEMQSAYGKYAKGELSDADINILADKYQRFAAKEKVYFSDRYQKTGTLATADALKLRRDAARDANAETDAKIKEIDMEVANARRGSPEYFHGLFAEKEALENSKTNVDHKDTEGKYYSALQFEAEKDVSDKYNGYKAEYGKNGVDYANKSGSFDKVDGMKTEKVSYKGASDFLAKYTDAYKTNIDSNIRELSEYGTDEQKDIFLQLFTEKGYKDALNYAKDIHPLISKQAAKIQGGKYEDSNALERFGMGVGAVFEGGIGDIGQSITGLGKALFRDTSYTHRNTAQQKADAVIEAEQNPVADLLMQAGRSAVANSPAIIAGIATGGSSLASTSVLFASAAGSAYVDAINKGNGYFNALGYGITNGAIEAATEKLFDIPGFYGGSKVDDAFKGIISKGVSKLSMGTKGKTALNFLGYMTANGFGEAVEEGITAAVEPTLGNIFLGEKNESFTAEHFGEIGYAALLGTVSSFLMPLSYVSTYADAKGDTAVWSVLNGEKVTDMQIEDIVNSRSSREIFEKAMGFNLSENNDVAKAQVTAVANSIQATSETIKGTDVSSVVENIDVSSVAEYTEAISDYITEPDAEYVANETEAVAEMTEIANEELAKTSTGAVQRIIEGTANSNDYHAVSKDAEARAEFTKMTGVELSAIPGEARSQMRAYASQEASDSPSETIAAVADQAVEETVSDLMDGVSIETASINEGVEADEELVDYGVSDRQAALERAVDGDVEIGRLTERYENGEMSEAEYNEAVTRRVSEIERSISEVDGDVSEVDSVPVADGVTENGGTRFMSKDDFDIVRNNSYSVTRNSAKDIKANPIFAKVSAAEIRAFRAVGKVLGVDVKAFDGETLGLTGTDGAYDNKTRTIYLNVTSPLKAISSAFRHEVIHYLKVSSPKAYGEFAAFVIDKYKAQYSNEDYNAWLEAKREEYEAMGETLTRDGAEEEFLAQFGMDMLQQKAIARDFVRHHRSAAMKVWDAIRNLINKIRRFYGMQELPTSVYDAISQLAENISGQVQVYGDSYTRSHLQGSTELLPGELNIDALNAADEALLNAFVEVANINKSIQAKLKNAPEDVLNDDVKRAQYIEELWAEETGVEVDNNEQIRYNKYWHTDLTKAEVIELSRIIRRDIRTSQNAITDTANWLFTQVNGKDVFAIYSTEEYNNPTILYESQKSKARFEHNYVLNLLGVLRNGSNTHGKSDIINQILASSRVRNIGGVDNNAKNVARRSGNRDGGVLQRQSKRRPSTALRSVLENLYEIRDRHGDGNRGRVDADDSVNTSDEKTPVKFSMSKPVEQTKDLIAVHNLNSPKLRKALELGGFPMPSIAITKANMGHDKFGDITLVFGRDTIDPAVDSDNKLYGGDAYTPTFPTVRYEANRNKVDELSTLYDDMRKRFGADDARPLYVYSDYSNAADTLNINGGEEGVIDYLKGDTNLMQLFLLDKTGNKVDTVMKRTEVKASDEDVKEYEFWLNELGKGFFDGLTPPAGVKYIDHARQYFEENKSTVLKTFSKMLTELYGYNAEEANNAVINSPESEFKSTLRRVYLYNKNGSVTVKEEPDYTATREQITKTAKAKGYDKWVEDTFKGIEGKKGIRNEKDLFTPSGKRRSFEDLHFDYTLDNIVRAMKQKNDKGISLFGGSIVGASAKNYKSVAQMKADSARLKQISQNEYDDIQKGFRDGFRELAARLANGNDSIDAGNLMAEAVAKYNTPSAIKNYIARESRGIYNYTDDIGNELLDIVNGIANMPTGYFEAKPKRAVGFDEVKFAVVPESIDADLRNGLEAVGTKVVTYKDGDSADRLEKLNSDSGVKFSKARVEEKGEYTEEQYASFGWVRDNDILNGAQYGDFTSKFADAVSGNVKFNKTKNGEFIIPVSDISEPDTEGVNRFLVFAKGKIDKPVISSIIEIYEYDETTLDETRRKIYESERRGIQPKIGETFVQFNASDFGAYEYKGRQSQVKSNNRDNGRPGRNTSEAVGSEKGTGQQGEVKYSKTKLDDTAKLKEKVNELKERIKLERKVTHRTILNRNQLDAFAGRILKQADSDYDRNTLVDNLQEIYSYLTTEGATIDSVFEKFRSLAEAVLGWKRQRAETDYEYKNIWDDIRGTHVRFTESQKQEIKHKYGTTAQRKFAGKIVSDNKAVGLDVWWQSWAEEYPHIFRKGVHEGDMAVELYEICEMLKEKSNVPVEYTDYELEDMAVKLAVDMYSGLDDVSPIKTAADIYDKKLTDVKAERDEAKASAANVDKLNKKLEQKTQKLEKTNADITARLADAERRLKITKPYSPDSKQIDALAERIADTFIGEYRGKNTVSNIAKSLTEIFRTWNEGNVKGNINKLAEADRMISNLASTLISGTSEYYGENEVVKALAGELTEEITAITPVKSTAAVNALARTEESLARTERKLNESDSKLSAARDVIKLTESNLKKAEAQLESAEKKLTVSTLRKESLQKKVDFLSHTRPIYIQKEIAQKRFDNANALADAAELDGLKSVALMYRNDAKFWQKQLDNVKKAEEYLDRKAMDRRRLREHISQKLGVPLATPDRSLPFVEQLKLVWNKHKNDSKELAVAKAVYKLNKEESKALLDFLKGEISYEEVIELGNKKTKDGEARYNVDKILKLARAMVNFANDEAVIADYNNETKRQRDKTTDEFLDRVDEAGGINDKGVAFNARATRETPERVIRMIVKDESLANEMINYYVKPIHTNEASANRFKNEVIKKVKDLKLETGIKKGNIVSESYAVQFVGEVEDNIRYLEKNAKSADTMRDGKTLLEWRETLDEFKKSNPNLDFDRIHKAIDVFRGIYDDLFSRVNEARMLNGYPPMPYRSGYFPHFTDEGSDGLLSKAARSMGLSGTVSELPSNISGLTYMFKPGIKWMANAMERTGYLTAFDALEGLDRYLASASDVIFHTGDIQRLRSLERRIRYRATDNGIKDRVDLIRGKRDWSTEKKKNRIDKILNDAGDDITLEIQDKIRKIEGDTSLTIEEQDKRIAEIFENARFDGSNFVVWLGEYTNNLAGKQALTDRIMEQKFGRAAFNVVSRLEGRIAKNMIIGNMSSYMSNFIPLTQAMAVLDSPASLTRGMIGTIRSIFKQDAVSTDSDFYRNRLGSDVLSMTFGENFADKLLTPMEIIDKFVAGSIVRARYYDNLKKGMSESDAMDEADTMAANIMADRSKGSVPVIFNDKNPISKMFTMFQVEVNNQVSFWTKDISAEAKKRGVANMALRLMLASILAWLFNDWYEELTGKKPALSPIDIINDAVGKGFGVKLNGPTEIVKELLDGDDQYWNPEKIEDYGIWQGISKLGEGVAEQLPFTSALNMFGLELDSGRLPVSGAYPDLAKLFTTVLDGKTSSEKKWDVAKDELVKPFYYAVLPMGGGQIKKINEGIGAIKRGGSYSNADKKGRRELQYPVFTDEGVWNIVKTVLFGKSSNEGAAEWVESGFKNALGDTATEVYISLKDSEAVSQRDVYNFLVELSGINKDTVLDGIIVPKDAGADVKKRAFLRQSSLPDEVKAIIYAGYIADKKNDEPELELLERAGDNVGVMYTVISDMKDGNTDNDKRIVLWNGNLPEGDKYRLYKALMYNNGEGSESAVEAWQKEDKKIDAFWDAGLTIDDYLKARIEKYGIEQKGLKPAAEANEFYSWARDNYGDEKAKVIYSTLPSSSGFVLGLDNVSGVKYADAGLSNDSANKILEALGGLEPLSGADEVSSRQKVMAIDGIKGLTKEEKKKAYTITFPNDYNKLNYVIDNASESFKPEYYFEMKEIGDRINKDKTVNDGSGIANAEVTAAINELAKKYGLTSAEKGMLWQIYTGSSSTKNNPFDKAAGQRYLNSK